MKKANKFFGKHSAYNATVHAVGGIGVGILIASPVAGVHPVHWGVALLILCLLGHVYAWFA